MDIVGQLQEGMTRFSAQESRVAAFILQNLSFTASASIDELAVRAGVSAPTITRFARSVGCEDIRDLRKQLAQACERRTSWLNEESAALPAAWRDKLSLISTHLEQQLVSTPESTLQSCARACKMPAPYTVSPSAHRTSRWRRCFSTSCSPSGS